jgi:predicted NodU family carbamoyl transferase
VHGARELGAQSMGRRSVLREAGAPDAATKLFASLRLEEPGREARLLIPEERAHELLESSGGADAALRYGGIAARARMSLRELAPSAIGRDGRVLARAIAPSSDPKLHALLLELEQRGQPPLLLHASFAPRGAPMVCGEADAVDAFRRSTLDALCVEDRIYEAR